LERQKRLNRLSRVVQAFDGIVIAVLSAQISERTDPRKTLFPEFILARLGQKP
jgi:hypothetical protein